MFFGFKCCQKETTPVIIHLPHSSSCHWFFSWVPLCPLFLMLVWTLKIQWRKNSLCFNELQCIMTISHTCQDTATPEPAVEGKALETSSGKEDCLSTQTAKRTGHWIIPEKRKWISRWKKFKLIMSGTSSDDRWGTSLYEMGTVQKCKQQPGSARCILKLCISCSQRLIDNIFERQHSL